jgi:hypothetical protein
MARLVFGMNQSLDGYVDHMAFAPGPNARLVEGDLEGAIRDLKAERDGEIEVPAAAPPPGQ